MSQYNALKSSKNQYKSQLIMLLLDPTAKKTSQLMQVESLAWLQLADQARNAKIPTASADILLHTS